ncbi:hypothetical protein ABT187_48210 [Streptomyces sp. NPDC001817]|uniref:hypothetical protein n=1 Tax=Streptomyces sp. NPDC001817 TaxID=3154398 RepID=UPI00332E55E9
MYIEVLPGVGDEIDRIVEVDRLAALLGTEAALADVAHRFYYQAEAISDGADVQVSALLAEIQVGAR